MAPAPLAVRQRAATRSPVRRRSRAKCSRADRCSDRPPPERLLAPWAEASRLTLVEQPLAMPGATAAVASQIEAAVAQPEAVPRTAPAGASSVADSARRQS